MPTSHEYEFATLVRFLKALADETRLRMLGMLAARERSVEELAAMLDLKAPTISHHLARLRELGLVEMRVEGNTHVYQLNGETLRALNRDLFAPERIAALASGGAEAVAHAEGAWERKVLRDFLEGERLKEIPASRKKRAVILTWLAGRFEPGRAYTEAEVNALLRRSHEDAATLRRELIGERLLRREAGVYWRAPAAESEDGAGGGTGGPP
ncbi:MAG: metalloregulator ArsR/SmtB family transcription factor [Ktedonobacterales bacterium]|nr:metalloregulator ArsR/SmtB family transcription factor [Ktedonobacterales bacterium]